MRTLKNSVLSLSAFPIEVNIMLYLSAGFVLLFFLIK